MPAPATVPEYLELVRKSGLVPDDRLTEVLDRHRAARTLPDTIDKLIVLLVREGLLTIFQGRNIKQGKYRKFTIGSKYRLLELIGHGGMGAVYLCEHSMMRRLVAVKVLPTNKLDDKSNLERFQREARAVAALDHPNIVRAYDLDKEDNIHFLVMEYVDGHSLQEIVARHGTMDPIRAAHYIAQSAVGLQHAHELGMVHRDIKPGNLLLERTGVVKILDMGLARRFNLQQDTVTEKYDESCVLGTADYLAPEQTTSNVVDIRADIYSLGGTLYFLLTGQTPFPDGTIAAKLVAHQTRPPKAVESFRKDVPPGILAVLKKMMEKDADDRYQEPIEVAEALAEWAEQPIAPPPVKEMPTLCPAVMAMTGHSLDKVGANVPVARSVFNPSRASPSGRAGGASGRVPTGGPVPRAAALKPATADAPARRPSNGSKTPAPLSTGRASAANTAPLPARKRAAESGVKVAEDLPPGENPSSVVVVVSHRRTALFVALGVLGGLLFSGGALAVYLAISGR
jgi:serine/threonine protein kinase